MAVINESLWLRKGKYDISSTDALLKSNSQNGIFKE